jgi:hypothetical protein
VFEVEIDTVPANGSFHVAAADQVPGSLEKKRQDFERLPLERDAFAFPQQLPGVKISLEFAKTSTAR